MKGRDTNLSCEGRAFGKGKGIRRANRWHRHSAPDKMRNTNNDGWCQSTPFSEEYGDGGTELMIQTKLYRCGTLRCDFAQVRDTVHKIFRNFSKFDVSCPIF